MPCLLTSPPLPPDMLGFGLTLLGGCVATTGTGQPSELYFPAHSVAAAAVSSTRYISAPRRATAENMAASAHVAYFLAEDVQKTGTRVSSNNWGLIAQSGDNGDVLFLSICAKQASQASSYATNLNITRADNTDGPGFQSSLYTSGSGLFSSKLEVSIQDTSVSVTDSFSAGTEEKTTVPLPDVRSAGDYPRYSWFGRNTGVTYHFVVATYSNAGLGIRSRTQGMRTMPLGFSGVEAVYENQSNTLLEL